MKTLRKTIFLAMVIAIYSFNTHSQSTNWSLDKSHSSVGFSIDHLVISETTGHFNDYTITIKSDKADFTDANFTVKIPVKAIDTKDAKRDEHLKGPDFFDAEKFPDITFTGKEFKKISGDKYKVIGDLTIHGITRRIEFDAHFGGIIKDPWGGTRAGLKLWGEIDRYDYGLQYNSVLEAGGLAIGKQVRIECRIELIKG